jgi:hypothetical protein
VSSSPHRSFERINLDDLAKLAQIALDDFADLFRRKEKSRRYAGGLRLICLCQGAARHYVHGDNGVQDFDLWGFFQEIAEHRFPARRRGRRDFGPSRFGRNPDDGDNFKACRVDVIGRSISMPKAETAIESVQRYLREGRTKSAALLAKRPVIVVWPDKDRGRVIWDGETVNPDPTVKCLRAIHPVDDKKLAAVKALMLELGSPRIRVVNCRDHYAAIEGSHRLAAAADLRIAPCLIVLAQDDPVDLDSTDISELFEPGLRIVRAGEIAARCQSHHNPVFIINPDRTLTLVAASQEED